MTESQEAPKEAKAPAKPVVKKYIVPNFGEPTAMGIIKDLKGIEEQIAVLSYLPYKSLINVAKSSKYAFNFIMHRPTRKRILCWKPEKEDETKINNYIMNYINKIAATKTNA